jgi:hypothetical protein
MIRISKYSIEREVAPQAIFWRPIMYFSVHVQSDEDNLDAYKYITYVFDNDVFDLRVYGGHPQSTVTLYLPEDIEDQTMIVSLVSKVMEAMELPPTSLAWKRGDAFEYGELHRVDRDRLREPEARLLALKIASLCPKHTASTEHIKSLIPEFYSLSKLDMEKSPSRYGENKWQQIVGNVRSHESSSRSLFSRGLAETTKDGLRVTKRGLDYLNDIGFSPDFAK